MQLSDGGILNLLRTYPDTITPFNREQLQPATYDLILGDEIILFEISPNYPYRGIVDPSQGMPDGSTSRFTIPDAGFRLYPKDFILATTKERVSIPAAYAARIEGKSSLGRLGLIVHSTAGFVDPGFIGNLTLEITNLNKSMILLKPGMRIAQLSFNLLDASALVPYGSPSLNSHYQFQEGVQQHRA